MSVCNTQRSEEGGYHLDALKKVQFGFPFGVSASVCNYARRAPPASESCDTARHYLTAFAHEGHRNYRGALLPQDNSFSIRGL